MDINKARNMLEGAKRNIEATLKKMDENDTAEQNANRPGELSNYDNHPAELGTELFHVTLNRGLKNHQHYMLEEINRALERIKDGNYGICEMCKKEIEEVRLNALPQARLCMECNRATENERRAARASRPVEEYVLDASLGGKDLDAEDYDDYEGLEYLSDLLKYGSADSPQDLGGYHDYKNYYNNEEDKQGTVEGIDRVSNQHYKNQLQ